MKVIPIYSKDCDITGYVCQFIKDGILHSFYSKGRMAAIAGCIQVYNKVNV